MRLTRLGLAIVVLLGLAALARFSGKASMGSQAASVTGQNVAVGR